MTHEYRFIIETDSEHRHGACLVSPTAISRLLASATSSCEAQTLNIVMTPQTFLIPFLGSEAVLQICNLN